MDWKGYTGNILYVNLTANKISVEKEKPEDLKRFIGGMGMTTKLAADLLKPRTDPFSPENVIILGAGPLVGTITPGAARIVGLSHFPASNAIANSCGSMSFGFQLKNSGYDHVVISGRSEAPVYLQIQDENIELVDAIKLWGLDIVDTTDNLRQKYGSCSVIAMGQAGESLVKSALALIDKTSTFGRGGLGAIMGSKNLKAIVSKGTRGVEIAKPKKFNDLFAKLFKRIRNYPHRKGINKLGMLRNTPIGVIFGLRGEKEKSKQCSERLYLKKLKKRRVACPSCPLGDKDILEIKEGPFSGLLSYTTSAINPLFMLLLKDLKTYDEAVKAFDEINRRGLDAGTVTEMLEFCSHLYEKGILTKEMTGLEWDTSFSTLMKMIEMITERNGFGNILADGWNRLAEVYDDIDKDMVVVKGLEQFFEPRYLRLGTMEFEQVVNPKGAHVASGGSPTYLAPGRPLEDFTPHFHRMGIPESAFKRIFSPPQKEMGINVGRLTRYAEEWYTVLTSLGLCARAHINRFWSIESAAAFYNAVTGFELSPSKLIVAAERTWNLLKILNMREGFSRKDDKFPEPWFKPLQFGPLKLKFQDFYGGVVITPEIANQLLNDYYNERGWEISTGLPTIEKIKELGLENF